MFLFQSESPSGTQLNALGIFLLSSLVFVVAALIEFSAVLFLSNRTPKDKQLENKKEGLKEFNVDVATQSRRRLKQSNVIGNLGGKEKMDIEASNRFDTNLEPRNCLLNAHSLRKIDYIAFCLFFSSYSIFNFIYWVILTSK